MGIGQDAHIHKAGNDEDHDYIDDVADDMDDNDGHSDGACVLVRLCECAHVCLCAFAHVQLK